jgi:hypothetical protein
MQTQIWAAVVVLALIIVGLMLSTPPPPGTLPRTVPAHEQVTRRSAIMRVMLPGTASFIVR